ncbi:MAG: helix-turn-helix domain-containing protein, partial [Eubacteriales bacterium]|nr:helix-turn-helix domain-containing protein [Eubacteriales bacterium]
MDISALSRKLKHYGSMLKINQPALTDIYDVAVLENNQENYDSGTLYILKSPELTMGDIVKGCKNILYVKYLDNDNLETCYREFKANFIKITAETDIDSIYNEIQLLIEEYNKYTNYSSKLYKLLFQDAGLQQIMETGNEMLGNPILLEDVGGRLIARAMNINSENLIKASSPLTENRNWNNLQETLSKRPFTFIDTKGLHRLVSKIVIENKLIAYLSVIGLAKAFHNSDADLLELLCQIISLEMQKNKYKYYFKQYTYEYILHDLIEGRADDNQPIGKMLDERGMSLKENLYLLTISSTHNQNLTNDMLELRYKLEAMLYGSKSIAYNDNILLVISRSANEILNADELDNIRSFFKENSIYGGLSLRFNNIKNIKKYYLQTLNAIELGLHLNKEHHLFLYGDYLFYHMLAICKQQEDLISFCHPSILQLIEHDKKNKTTFVQTLYEYIKHKGNHKETADTLHIFHSTLVYRIKKIREIIGTELDNDYMFQLELSFKILEYLNKLAF